MQLALYRHKFLRWPLILVCWVIFVCAANNIGLLSSCSLPLNDPASNSVQQKLDAEQGKNGLTDKCELSDHLVHFEQHQVGEHVLIVQIFTVLLIIGLLLSFSYTSLFTEPILHKGRRLHLKFCVFRE
ncbi:copper resistance protein [Aliivibrio sifiae]|uniref:Copper resistance protein n=1 Tax=Aliivibrio sifiae TaxID=566293 RepID=A0A2S7X0C2_9GAMM|nr:copper resistance protein [Aliivibrio sifiae]